MAPVRTWFLAGGLALRMDATIRESGTSRLNVTKNPVETGVTIADHAFMDPLQLEIEGAVSDVLFPDRVGDADVDEFASPTSRATRALQILQDWQTTAEPATIQTGLRAYQNMVMESLSYDQDVSTDGVLAFRATLTEVIIRNTQAVIYPPRAPGKTARQASKKADDGQKQATPVTEAPKVKSIALSLYEKAVQGDTAAMAALAQNALNMSASP
jgi:hypothetical protein